MNHSISYFSSPVTDALGWTLLHAMWQGFALVLPVAVGLYLLRNGSSALRYRLGVLALLTQVLASVATFFWYYDPAVTLANRVQTTYPVQALHVRWQIAAEALPWHDQVQQFLDAHLNQFVLMYLIGVAVFALRLAGGWLYLQRLSRTAVQPASEQITDLTQSIRSIMQITAMVRVYESAQITVPLVVGVLKPVLLLPISVVTTLSIREIEAVLAHELAHIKRHDYAVNLLQSVVEVLYFFHPALWWLSARVREEREHCCDDLAVQTIGGDGRTLAQALAHVEELRSARVTPPSLAMAFANKRQQLLHRVRRMLGVQTRPLVSNGSLAGLTLATILLVSASVYAIQQDNQPKPKPRAGKSQSTRRHKAANGTEFTVTNNRKISHVVWKGQKLPAAQVARLQRQFDQILAGQLSLDSVKQPDRDILLSIIETNKGFADGMDALSEGLAQLDYNNIILSSLDAAKAVSMYPADVDAALKEVEKLDYNTIISEAMASIDTNIYYNDRGLVRSGNTNAVQNYHHREADSLARLMAQRSQQMQALALQMEKMRFPVEELERSEQVLTWRKEKLLEERNSLFEKHQRLLNADSKQKQSIEEVEKQLKALEPEFKKHEASIDELNKQLEELMARQDAARRPLEQLGRDAERLSEEMSRWSEQMGQHSNAPGHFSHPEPMINVRAMSPAARPVVAPRPPKAVHPARPAQPGTPAPVARPDKVRGVVAPGAPVPPAAPRPTPKLATPPTPPEPNNE